MLFTLQAFGSTFFGLLFAFVVGVPLGDLAAEIGPPVILAIIGYRMGIAWPNLRPQGQFSWILPFSIWAVTFFFQWISNGWRFAYELLEFNGPGASGLAAILLTVPVIASCTYSLGLWLSGRFPGTGTQRNST
jgi:hypothetical protein